MFSLSSVFRREAFGQLRPLKRMLLANEFSRNHSIAAPLFNVALFMLVGLETVKQILAHIRTQLFICSLFYDKAREVVLPHAFPCIAYL